MLCGCGWAQGAGEGLRRTTLCVPGCRTYRGRGRFSSNDTPPLGATTTTCHHSSIPTTIPRYPVPHTPHVPVCPPFRTPRQVYGLGSGMFFLGYSLFMIPSNALVTKVRVFGGDCMPDEMGCNR